MNTKGEQVNVSSQAEMPVAQEQTVEEMQLAWERLDERHRALDVGLLELAVDRCEQVALAAAIQATIAPSKTTAAAHAAARVEEERSREQLARRGAEVRAIEEAKEKLRYSISRITSAQAQERVEAGLTEYRARLAKSLPACTAGLSDLLVVAALSGSRPWAADLVAHIAKHTTIDLRTMCDAAQGTANRVRAGTNGKEN